MLSASHVAWQVFPELANNIMELRSVSLQFASPRDALFQNFKMAGRGSIRKPPNLIDWVHSLKQLAQTAGERDSGVIIKLWNGQCAAVLQIVGRKAMALKNLLDMMPPAGLELVTRMVSATGWEDGCWTEDALASKRIFPGYAFRCHDSKAWTARQTVTTTSCVLMIERILHDAHKGVLRGKLLEKVIAERAQMSAIVHNVSEEIQKTVPLMKDDVEMWLDSFRKGDPSLDMEVRSAMLRHDAKFLPASLPSLQALLEKHHGKTMGGGLVHHVAERVKIQATELEDSTFQLLQKQVQYDLEAFKCYLAKVKNAARAIHHKQMEWQAQAFDISQAAAEVWWAKNVSIINSESASPVQDLKDVIVELSKRHSVPAERVIPMVIVNWSAPCQINVSLLRLQADLLADTVRANKDTLAVLLMPQFAYKQSELWLSEQMVMQLVMERRLMAHRKWSLMFAEQVDTRDKRPLAYDGRVVSSLDSGDKEKDSLWASAKIMRGRTEMAKQLPGKLMTMVEDVDDTALPQSVDTAEVTVKGAAKYAQVGEDAMQKVLDAIMEGPDWNKQQGNVVLLLMELNPGVGNMLDAFMTRRAALRMPMHYVGLADNNKHYDWLVSVKVKHLRDKHYKGELQVAGHPAPATDLPADLLDTPPSAPTLNKLTIVKGEGVDGQPMLRVPTELVNTWGSHPRFQAEFETMITGLQEELGESFGGKGDDPAGDTARQKRRLSVGQESTPAKKQRVEEKWVVKEEEMVAGQDLFRTPLISNIAKDVSKVYLVIKPQHRIYLLNAGDKEVELAEGTLVAGFGKGKFKFKEKEPEANPETHISFCLQSHDQKIMIGTTLRTLKSVVDEKRKTDANPKVCYHKMEEIPGDELGAFKVVQVTEVLFGLLEQQDVPKDGGKDLLINRVGALIPISFWTTHCTDIVWSCKWTPAGLQAVRPVVCLTMGVTLPAGHALACN